MTARPPDIENAASEHRESDWMKKLERGRLAGRMNPPDPGSLTKDEARRKSGRSSELDWRRQLEHSRLSALAMEASALLPGPGAAAGPAEKDAKPGGGAAEQKGPSKQAKEFKKQVIYKAYASVWADYTLVTLLGLDVYWWMAICKKPFAYMKRWEYLYMIVLNIIAGSLLLLVGVLLIFTTCMVNPVCAVAVGAYGLYSLVTGG